MQQPDDKLPKVLELPVHLLVKSQKEAKKPAQPKIDDRLSSPKEEVWYKITTWYKK